MKFDYQPLEMPEGDKDYLEMIKMNTEEIARVFGVPAGMLQAYEKATFSHAERFDFIMPKVICRYFERLPRKAKKRIKKVAIFYGRNVYMRICGLKVKAS